MLQNSRIFAFLLCSICMTPAVAGIQGGTVKNLVTRSSDGLVYVDLHGAGSDKPACATKSYWIIKDENSNAGKRILAMLLTAKLTGQPFTIIGSGACTRWSDGEDIETVIL